jgi:hypothetical protein
MTRHIDADFTDHAPRRRDRTNDPPPPALTPEQERNALVALSEQGQALAARQSQLAAMMGYATGMPRDVVPLLSANTPSHPPLMKINDERPPLGAYLGTPGVPIYDGIINDPAEYNRDFYWRDGVAKYDEMFRSDAQVRQSLAVMSRPIRRAKWDIQPVSDAPIDQEIASFTKSALFDDMTMTTSDGEEIIQTWDDILRHLLLMFTYGFSCMEYVWRRDKAGWTKWACWAPILPRTVWRWWTGGNGELLGIQQYAYKDGLFQFIEIPAKKLLRVTFDQMGNNYDGVSPLRSAYPHWFYKQQYYAIESVGLERTAIPMPVIHLPVHASAADYDKARQIGENMRANERMHVKLPEGWAIELLQGHADSTAIQAAIEHHDRMIARNVGAMFLNLGGQRGAMNLDKSQTQTFMQSIQAEADYLAERITASAIRKLVKANYSGVKVYPKLFCSKISTQDADSLSKTIQALAGFINPDPTTEDWLRDELGMPMAAPVTSPYEINSNNPSGGEGGDGTDNSGDDSGGKGSGSDKGAGNSSAEGQPDTTGGGDAEGGDGGGEAYGEPSSSPSAWLLDESYDAVERAILHMEQTAEQEESVQLAGFFGGLGRMSAGVRGRGGLSAGMIGGNRRVLRLGNGRFNGSESLGSLGGARAHHTTEELQARGGGAKTREAGAPRLGRPPKYASAAERQRAYYERLGAEQKAQQHETGNARARAKRLAAFQARHPELAGREPLPEGMHRVVPPVLLHRIAEISPVASGRSTSDITHLARSGAPVLHSEAARRSVARIEMDMRNSGAERVVGVTSQGVIHELGPSMRGLVVPRHIAAQLHGGALVVARPLGGAPKLADYRVASALGVRQLRVATPFYRHAVSLVDATPMTAERFAHFAPLYRHTRAVVEGVVIQAVRAKQVSPWHATRQFGHVVWQQVANPARLHYVRAAWDEDSALMREPDGDDGSIQLFSFGRAFGGMSGPGRGGRGGMAGSAFEALHPRGPHGMWRNNGGRHHNESTHSVRHAHGGGKSEEESAGRGKSAVSRGGGRVKSPNAEAARRTAGKAKATAKGEGAAKSLEALKARGEQIRTVGAHDQFKGPGHASRAQQTRLLRKWNTLHETYKGYVGRENTHEAELQKTAFHLELLVRRGWGPGSAQYDRAEAHFNETKKAMMAERRAASKVKAPAKAPAAKKAAAPKAENIHQRAARLQREGNLPKESRPEEHGKVVKGILEPQARFEARQQDEGFWNPGKIYPASNAKVYGEENLGAVLSRISTQRLVEHAGDNGIAHGSSRASVISAITAHYTEGRYSANFAKAAAPKSAQPKAPKPSAAERNAAEIAGLHAASAKWQAEHPNAPREKIAHGKEIVDLVPVTANGHLTYGKDGELDVNGLRTLYGEHQLGAALTGYTRATLKEMAGEFGVSNHSGTPPQLISRITAAATHGHYSANFPHEAKVGKAAGTKATSTRGSSSRSAKGKSPEKVVDDMMARWATDRAANHDRRVEEARQEGERQRARLNGRAES